MSITTTQLSPRPDLVPQVQTIGGTITTFDVWNQTTAPLVVQLTRASWDIVPPGGRFQYLVSSLGGFPGWITITPQQTASFSAASSQAIFLTTYQSGDSLPQCPAGTPTGNPPIAFGSPYGPMQGLRQAGLQVYNVRDFGALGNGSTDDSGAIQKALNAAAITGGIVEVPPATYAIASTLVPPGNITVMGYGATLLWTGATSGMMVSNTASLNHLNWFGLNLNGNQSSLTGGFLLQSVLFCCFRDCELNNFSNTTGTIAVQVNTSGTGGDPEFAFNSGFNIFLNVQIRRVAIGLDLDGGTSGGGKATTDNRFYGLTMWDIGQIGIRFVQTCDNNYFYGTLVNLGLNGATGVIFNDSATPTSNVGVYGIHCYGFAIDAGAVTGATGLLLNRCDQITVRGMYWTPAPTFNGTLVNDAHGESYEIELMGFDPPQVQTKKMRQVYLPSAASPPTLGALQSGVSTQTIAPATFNAPADRMGVLQIVTAGASPPAAGAALAIINFGAAFGTQPIILMTNNGTVAGTFYATPGTTSFTVRTNAALTISTTYTMAWYILGV